jgi:hypothetical protein
LNLLSGGACRRAFFCTAVFGSAGRKGGGLRTGRGVKKECGKIKSDREEVIE